MDTFNSLLKSSILTKEIKLLDWFQKSVETCPAVIGKTVRWNIKCFECEKVILSEVDNWGSMDNKKYDKIICFNCLVDNYAKIANVNHSIPQYEI